MSADARKIMKLRKKFKKQFNKNYKNYFISRLNKDKWLFEFRRA